MAELLICPMRAEDAAAVLGVYAAGIATGHATFETDPPTWEAWDKARLASPRLVAVQDQGAAAGEGGEVVGFAALSPTSARRVYQGVLDVMLYVAPAHRGQGIGRRLLEALVEAADAAGHWTLQAGIFPENRASLATHAACGFRLVGRRERIGLMRHGPMAGKWRDVLLLERRRGGETQPALKVAALLFDVFGTLVDWRGSIAREAAALGLPVDGAAFADAWRARYQPSMSPIRDGTRPFVRLDVLHRESLIATLEDMRLPPMSEAALDHLTMAWHRLDPWPDVVEGLSRLKARHVIAPCSNGNVALMVDLAKRAGLPWDAILGAEPTRAYKPSPECYLRSADMLGLEPGQCMMVAAHNADLAAASALGLKTAFIPRPHEHGPGQAIDLEAEGPWSICGTDLVDVAVQLGC